MADAVKRPRGRRARDARSLHHARRFVACDDRAPASSSRLFWLWSPQSRTTTRRRSASTSRSRPRPTTPTTSGAARVRGIAPGGRRVTGGASEERPAEEEPRRRRRRRRRGGAAGDDRGASRAACVKVFVCYLHAGGPAVVSITVQRLGGVAWHGDIARRRFILQPADIASVFRYARLYGGRKTGGLKSCVITGQAANVACRFSCLTASLRSASQLQG